MTTAREAAQAPGGTLTNNLLHADASWLVLAYFSNALKISSGITFVTFKTLFIWCDVGTNVLELKMSVDNRKKFHYNFDY